MRTGMDFFCSLQSMFVSTIVSVKLTFYFITTDKWSPSISLHWHIIFCRTDNFEFLTSAVFGHYLGIFPGHVSYLVADQDTWKSFYKSSLMALVLLKIYNTKDDNCALFSADTKTSHKWIWLVVETLESNALVCFAKDLRCCISCCILTSYSIIIFHFLVKWNDCICGSDVDGAYLYRALHWVPNTDITSFQYNLVFL